MSAKSKPQNERSFSFDELLDSAQPYREFHRLNHSQSESSVSDDPKLKRIQGSLVGLAVGDALGASVEFRPYEYMKEHPVHDMQGGGTWGLAAGHWTDDTSMALCLAASLIVKTGFDPYDQFDRYRRWFRDGYMSSTGQCFDIGKSTREAIIEFEEREKSKKISKDGPVAELLCGAEDAAGNGPLMRLAPIPLFFSQTSASLFKDIEIATKLTHGSQKAVDACRFYAGLIWHAVNGQSKDDLLKPHFYKTFAKDLDPDVKRIAEGSYRKKGYEEGIRGKGYVLDALEAALWAFYTDDNSFKTGVLNAINLGDDTDTTAAIYGELAGAVYGIDGIPEKWRQQLFQEPFIMAVAKELYVGPIIKSSL